MNELISIQAAAELIRGGATISLAGSEAALDQLPQGNWIAGTIPYFITESGGVVESDKVFVTDLTDLGWLTLASYGVDGLNGIVGNCPDNGFALTIIPAGSTAHQIFSANAASFEGAFLKPTVGWISGVHISQIGKVTPKVFDGRTGTKYEDRAVVMYVELPPEKLASVEIVNLFEPGDGDVLHFEEDSFNVETVMVNGERLNFAKYIRDQGFDNGSLPLVGDFGGANINVSLQTVGQPGERVAMYAPVFTGVDYRFAKPVGDYAAAFRSRLAPQETGDVAFSCNCILNFLFGSLEGKTIGGAPGPVTFGEIAYQLLNQTLVVVRVL